MDQMESFTLNLNVTYPRIPTPKQFKDLISP